MKNKKLAHFWGTVQKGAKDYAPELWAAAGIAGFAFVTYTAYKQGQKSAYILEDLRKAQMTSPEPKEITTFDELKATWKCWSIPMVEFAVSAACICESAHKYRTKTAELATAVSLSERALVELHDKAVEKIGEKKTEEIEHEVKKDHANENAIASDGEDITITGYGNQLFYDVITDQFFRSNITKIKDIISDLNAELLDCVGGYVDFWDYCDEMNIQKREGCNDLRWEIQGSARDSLIQLNEHDVGKHPITGEAFTYIDFYNRPTHYCNVYY